MLTKLSLSAELKTSSRQVNVGTVQLVSSACTVGEAGVEAPTLTSIMSAKVFIWLTLPEISTVCDKTRAMLRKKYVKLVLTPWSICNSIVFKITFQVESTPLPLLSSKSWGFF